ncbi:hypothetical protein QUF80_04655 [Desulfococcaceae bacterium HSG8]|nr:hypothetical protein [Desulfococcaceae bacterium HSG8]
MEDKSGLRIRPVYYPPCHSKYRGVPEEHRNGEIPDSVDKVLSRAATMTWKGIKPVVHLWEKIYGKGIRLTKKEMKPCESRIGRSDSLPKWDVIIEPLPG